MSYGPEWGEPDGDHWRKLRQDCERAVDTWKARRIGFQKAAKRLLAAQAMKGKAAKLKAIKEATARVDHERSLWTPATLKLATAIELRGIDSTPALNFHRALQTHHVVDEADEIDAACVGVDILLMRLAILDVADKVRKRGQPQTEQKRARRKPTEERTRRIKLLAEMLRDPTFQKLQDNKGRGGQHDKFNKKLGVNVATSTWKEYLHDAKELNAKGKAT